MRCARAISDIMVATAILDPRYNSTLADIPADDLLRGEKFIDYVVTSMYGEDSVPKVKAQLIKYKTQPASIGATAAAFAATVAHGIMPEVFWQDLSPHAPELSRVARMLLVIPPASATRERLFSAVGQVWDAQRSRVTNTRVDKLLFIYHNSRALQRDGATRDADDFGAFVEWLCGQPE